MVCIGDENDQGYTYNFMRGVEEATAQLAEQGINVEWVYKTQILEDSGCEDANIELADAGCQIIINNSYGFEPYMLRVAEEYPEIEFIACTNQASWNDDLPNTQMGQLMAQVKKYLRENYMYELSLDSIGDILHISPAYLSTQFKKYLHVGFLDYLTEVRIQAACELLTDPLRPTAEVAGMVGYEDASYFARAFKKKTGLTPTQYRREAARRHKEQAP